MFVGGNRTHFYRSSAVAAAYDREGALLWSYVRDDAAGSSNVDALHVFSNGNLLLVGGRIPSGGTRALLLVELSRDGELVAEQVSEDVAPRSVAVAQRPEGTVLMLRTTTGIAVVSLSGEVLREATFGEEEDPKAFAAGLDGDVFVVGSRLLASGELAPWVARYDESLARQWEQVVARRGELTAAAVGPNGDVFVTGRVVAPPVGKASDFTNLDIWIGRFAR
ncbi:MAG: hypothetical protein IAG13_35630 [Deltaproteobacteria bacterium]|nr:hypothetical protein [Nannocystaceae bacterium]